jgi:hypothetical protein
LRPNGGRREGKENAARILAAAAGNSATIASVEKEPLRSQRRDGDRTAPGIHSQAAALKMLSCAEHPG